MDRVVTRSVNRSHEAVMLIVVRSPPRGGEDSDGIREAMQAREELPTYHRQTHHAPSFIGGDAAIRLIVLSQRSSTTLLAS